MKLNVDFSEHNMTVAAKLTEDNHAFGVDVGEVVVVHDGQNGATFYPSVSEDGVISWTNDRELDNPPTVNIRGKDGVDGKDGKDGVDGKDGYTPVKGVDYFDGVNGKDGKNGLDGRDGYTPVKGKDYFDGKDGYTPVKGVDYFDGKDGVDGEDGYTPVRGTDYWTDADKQEIVTAVLAALPAAEGVSF